MEPNAAARHDGTVGRPQTSAVPVRRMPLGLLTFGGLALLFLGLVWSWPNEGMGLWGPAVSTALAWGVFLLHVVLVRRYVNAFDPIVWVPVLILLYHTGGAIAIEYLGTAHSYDGLGIGEFPRLHQTFGAIVLTLVSFLFGCHLAGFRDARRPIFEPLPNPVSQAGLCLLVGGFIMSTIGIFVFGPSLLFGSYADMKVASTLGLSDFRLYGTGNLFLQTGIFAILASRDPKRPGPIVLAAIGGLYYASILFVTGFRGHLSAFVFGSGWLIASRFRKLPHWVVVTAFTTMFILIPIMKEFREHKTVEEGTTYALGQLTAQAFFEMGAATQPLAHTIDLIPSEKPFDWGLSAVAALLSNIPNFGAAVSGWTYKFDAYQHLPSVWFTATMNPVRWALRGGGYGFSMAAEWYWNFGFPGILLGLTTMGWLLTWLRNQGGRSAFLMTTTSLFIAMMSINIRNAMGYPSRMFLWGFIGLVTIHLGFSLFRSSVGVQRPAPPSAEGPSHEPAR